MNIPQAVRSLAGPGFAKTAPQPQPGVTAGVVLRLAGPDFFVALDGVESRAMRAVSCLVEPVIGDEVLVFARADACHILAVLTRSDLGDARLSLPDRAGRLTVEAQSIGFQARTRIDLAAPEVAVATRRMHVVADVLTRITRLASLIGETLTVAVGRQSTVARQIDVKADTRSTTVTGIDTERLGTRVTQAELTASTTCVATLHAKEDIRLDAKRVTIG